MHYKFHTSNSPSLDPLEKEVPPHLKDWGEPCWEIYVMENGSVEVAACRPTGKEIGEGDLHGVWGSIIHLDVINRSSMKNALWLARKLCTCDPVNGILIPPHRVKGIRELITNIPVLQRRG